MIWSPLAGEKSRVEGSSAQPTRRALLSAAALFAAAAFLPRRTCAATEDFVEIEEFSASGQSLGTKRLAKVVKSEAEWRNLLSPQAYTVTRQAGTERAFSGAHWNSHDDGLYRCVCCDTALFESAAKYDSGTGWPSFWRPISEANVVESEDSFLWIVRRALSCRRCDAHLGHVFDDGPQPTGLRYCMNSAALRFVARVAAAG